MAVNPVSLPDFLRPWQQAGLHYLLLEQPAATIVNSPAQSPPANVEPLAAQYEEAAVPNVLPTAMPLPRPAVRPTPLPSPSPEQSKVAVALSLPALSAWPSAWQALWGRTKPAPVVWSYPELGADICRLQPERAAEHSALLKGLITRLTLPKGCSTFWPPSLPDANTQEAAFAPTFYQSGLNLLQPKAIIFFGPDDLLPAGFTGVPSLAYQQHLANGRLLIILPPFASLLQDLDKRETSLAYLRSALSSIRLGSAHP